MIVILNVVYDRKVKKLLKESPVGIRIEIKLIYLVYLKVSKFQKQIMVSKLLPKMN